MSTWLSKIRSYWKFILLRERLAARGDAAALAARELGKLGDLRAVPLLIRSLAYGNGALQTQAAIALGKLGDPAALPALRRVTRYGTPAVESAREQAVLAVVAIEKAARGSLVGLLADPDERIRRAALRDYEKEKGSSGLDELAGKSTMMGH